MTPKRRDDPTLYLIAWDDGIVKFGFSGRRRWRSFSNGRLLLALGFRDSVSGYQLEMDINHQATLLWPAAFATKEDAVPYLGNRGGGYMECYRASAADAMELAASRCAVTLWRHGTPSHIDVRTYGLTKTQLQVR